MAFDIDAKPGYGPAAAPAKDVGPEARRAATGKAPEPKAKTDAELGIDQGPEFYRGVGTTGRADRSGITGNVVPNAKDAPGTNAYAAAHAGDEMNDPGAQLITAGAMAAPLAVVAGGATVAAGAPAIAPVVTGAVAGAEQAAMTGQDPRVGALVGGALPAAGAVMGKLAPWGQAAARRIAEREVTDLGQAAAGAGKGKTQAALMKLDPEKVAQTMADNGISLRGQSAAEAQAAQRAAMARTGQELGAARDAIDAADPARKTVGDVMKAVQEKIDALRSGPKANPPLADAIHAWSKDYFAAQGGKDAAAVSVKDISQTISALEEKGYGGMSARLPGGDAKIAARQIAGALNGVLDDHIKAVSASNPAAAAAAKEIAAKTAEFRVLKTVQPIVDQRAVAERFAPTAAQAFAKDPVGAAKKAALSVVTKPVTALAGAPRAADAIMARLFTAKAAGQVTPQLLQEAERAGIAAPILQHFMRPAEQR